tara:strand:- start:17226 stop:20111 length:2886 start_codon:yes stop_codon:yes gene_type:complete
MHLLRLTLIVLLGFQLVASSQAFSQDTESRRSELVNIIDLELKEITRLNRTTGNTKPELLLRMAELLLEKARLLKDKETKAILEMSPEQRRRTNMKAAFSQSNKYFIQAQRTCQLIAKKFPRYRGLGDVYYIMAFNYKEFGDEKKAERYFAVSLKKTKSGTASYRRAQLALAETYYNQQKYKQAIPLYESALRTKDNRWWTKDSLNLSWSYFRIKDYNKAIGLIREVGRLSESKDYVDMSQEVERDLAFFYTEAGRTKEAVDFYKNKGGDVAANLLKVGMQLKNQGKFTIAQATLEEALANSSNDSQKIRVQVELLSVYEKFGNINKHLATCQDLATYYQAKKLEKEDTDKLLYHVKRMAAVLQKQVASGNYSRQKKTQSEKANAAVSYFALTATLEPTKAARHQFHAAETMYANEDYDVAAQAYVQALNLARQNGDTKYEDMAMDGLVSTLSRPGVSAAVKEKYLEFAYIASIKKERDPKKRYTLYQRLFTLYADKKEFSRAEQALVAFRKEFPKSIGVQEAMLGKVIDHYRSVNDKNSVFQWVGRINNGEFVVSKQYADKLRLIVLTLQFDSVEKYSSKGDKKRALQGYVEIYRNKLSPVESRKNAAYNITILFHELGHADMTKRWAQNTLELFDRSDMEKFSPTFLSIGNDFLNAQRMDDAFMVYNEGLQKLCRGKDKSERTYFRNAHIVALAKGDINAAKNIVSNGYRCKIPTSDLETAQMDIIRAYADEGQINDMMSEVGRVSKVAKLQGELIPFLEIYRKAISSSGRSTASLEKQMIGYYLNAKKRGYSLPVDALNAVALIKAQDLESYKSRLESIDLKFPEAVYNKALQTKLAMLDKLTDMSKDVMSVGSGEGIARAYRVLVEAYLHVSQVVADFTPVGKSPEYVQSFRASMGQVAVPLKAKSDELRSEALAKAKSEDILSSDINFLQTMERVSFGVEHHPSRQGVVMDRGGSR